MKSNSCLAASWNHISDPMWEVKPDLSSQGQVSEGVHFFMLNLLANWLMVPVCCPRERSGQDSAMKLLHFPFEGIPCNDGVGLRVWPERAARGPGPS
ncbi:uncharacterized protein ACIQIH_012224 isoform 2-T2 [Cyanocitta cristata]